MPSSPPAPDPLISRITVEPRKPDRALKPIDPVAIAPLEGEPAASRTGDARLVELFRQRQEARRSAGTNSADMGRCERLEARMMEIPASGVVGMAIKIYLL